MNSLSVIQKTYTELDSFHRQCDKNVNVVDCWKMGYNTVCHLYLLKWCYYISNKAFNKHIMSIDRWSDKKAHKLLISIFMWYIGRRLNLDLRVYIMHKDERIILVKLWWNRLGPRIFVSVLFWRCSENGWMASCFG